MSRPSAACPLPFFIGVGWVSIDGSDPAFSGGLRSFIMAPRAPYPFQASPQRGPEGQQAPSRTSSQGSPTSTFNDGSPGWNFFWDGALSVGNWPLWPQGGVCDVHSTSR